MVVCKIMLIFVFDMRKITRAYGFRLCPNKEQVDLLARHLVCAWFMYNYFLNQRKEQCIWFGLTNMSAGTVDYTD